MQPAKVQISEEEAWYILISNETRGPLSLRDLDVLLRTNQINSRTYGWKAGMKDWKVLNEIEQIKEGILESSKQIIEIQKKRESLFDKNQKEPEKEGDGADQIIENKDEDPMVILELTIENVLKQSFHQSEDGMWNIYDQEKAEWTKQQTEPIDQIQRMKQQLFTKLKNSLFFEDKKRKKNTTQEKKSIPEESLTEKQLEKRERNKKKTKRAALKKKDKWYNAKINTFIYISGLPYDITEEQLKEFVSKAGVLRIDLNSGKEKLKIYKQQNGFPKGDAAVSYAREQSVEIALQNLNNSEIRSGFPVKIERARFNQKEEDYKPREQKKASLVKKIQAKKNEMKQLTWGQEFEEEGVSLRIVVMKHIFDPDSPSSDIEEIKKDIAEELALIGEVTRIRFYETHPEGVVQVKFKTEKDAQNCIQIMNQRYFDGREVECDYWDGTTDYKHNTLSLTLQSKQLEQFGQELERQPEFVTQQLGGAQKQKVEKALDLPLE